MEETQSKDSKKSAEETKTKGKNKANAANKEDKKKIKALKGALKDEIAKRESLEEELAKLRKNHTEVETELQEKEGKLLELYEENSQMQEKIYDLQQRVKYSVSATP